MYDRLGVCFLTCMGFNRLCRQIYEASAKQLAMSADEESEKEDVEDRSFANILECLTRDEHEVF